MEELAIKLQETTDRSLRNEARINKLEANQTALNELALSVQDLATNQVNMKEDLGEIKQDVKALTSVPAKRWESLIEKGIAVLLGAFITWLITHGVG